MAYKKFKEKHKKTTQRNLLLESKSKVKWKEVRCSDESKTEIFSVRVKSYSLWWKTDPEHTISHGKI